MEEIVVARPDRSAVAVVAVGVLVIVTAAVNVGGWRTAIWMVPLGVATLYWFAEMKLSVTSESVVVVNFASRKYLDLTTVQIVDQAHPLTWPVDDTERERAARALYLTDESGQRVRVAVAPSRGHQLDTIAEALYRAIATMQAER